MNHRKFKQFETVCFVGSSEKWEKLRYGDLGAVLEVYDDSHYEVEFTYPDGTTKELAAFSSDEIEAVN